MKRWGESQRLHRASISNNLPFVQKLFLSRPMLVMAALLSVTTVAILNWQHSYVPFFRLERREHEDFLVYYRGTKAFWEQDNLYLKPFELGTADPLPYSYPPSSLVIFTPLSWLPEEMAWRFFELVSLAALWWVLVLTLRRCGVNHAWQWALIGLPAALWVDPVRNTFYHGQINVLLMALVLTDLWWDSPKRKYLPRGLLIGVAAAIKMTPALFGLYLLFKRDWEALMNAFAAGAAALAAAAFIRPQAFVYYFTTQISSMSDVLGINRSNNQSLRALVARFIPPEAQDYFLMILLAGMIVLGLMALRRLFSAGADEAAVLCVALLSLLLAPVTWQHHYVWAVPICVVLVCSGMRNRNPWLLLMVAVFLSVSTVFVPHLHIAQPGAADPNAFTVRDLAQSSMVMWGIALLALMWLAAPSFSLAPNGKRLSYRDFITFRPLLGFAAVCAVATAFWRKMESPLLSHYEGNFHPLTHLQIFDGAGKGFFSDPDIYTVGFNMPDGSQERFMYPPATMFASRLLGFGELVTWEAAHTIVGTFAVWWTLYAVWRRLDLPEAAASATVLLPAALWLDPVRFNFYYGELAVFAVALVVTDLWWEQIFAYRRPIPRGLITGVVAAFTLRPLFVLVLFALKRDWKSAGWMSGAFAAVTMAAALPRPGMTAAYFTDYIFNLDTRFPLDHAQNLSLLAAVLRFTPAEQGGALYFLAAALVGGLLLYAARACVREGDDPMAFALLSVAALVCSPWAPPYTWVWMLPGVVVMVAWAVKRREAMMLLVPLTYLALSTVFVPHSQFKNLDRIVDRDREFADWVMSSVVWWAIAAAVVAVVWAASRTVDRAQPMPKPSPAPEPV